MVARRRIICLVLAIVFSAGGVYTAVHLAEIHYKKPRYMLNLLNAAPFLDRYYDREEIEQAVDEERLSGSVSSSDISDNPFDDPGYDPYETPEVNPYANMMTEEEAASGRFHREETCDISEQFSCTIVDDSKYSEIGGIAISIYGIIGYGLIALLALICIGGIVRSSNAVAGTAPSLRGPNFFALALYLGSWFGFLFSLWLTYAEAFLIDSFCPYCLASAVLMALIHICVLVAYGVEPVADLINRTGV